MGVACKNCGGTTLDNDIARGDSVCVNCGSVVENLCIVNEVEFQENSAGNASVIGQFVSAEGHHTSLGENFKYGIGRDHKQMILDNGRHQIQTLGAQLKMSSHCLDAAFMFYKMAVSKRFTSGRKTLYVIGACLYLVSRTEKTPHMLLDICDVVQCDVIALGRVFLQLARELCIDCPIVDPSLYIHRFAHQLDFGEQENEVSMTALRIMARMKKDWIHFGRRPSALCGAALIIAAKLHGFHVTMDDIVKLVRMSKTTVFKRLADFSKTATGKLTTEEFKTVDLEEEADPPCYTEGRNRKKFAQEIKKEKDSEDLKVSSDILSQVVKTQEKLKVLLDKRKSIKSEIATTDEEAKSFDYRSELPQDYSLYSYELDDKGEFNFKANIIHHDDDDEEIKCVSQTEQPSKNCTTTASSTLLFENSIKKETDSTFKIDQSEWKESEEIDLEGIDDEEIDKLLLTEEEIEVKTSIWLEENREYLIKMKEKEEELKKKEKEDEKNGLKKKRKPTKRKQKDKAVCDTADEAIKTMLAERKLSSKINYDVLRGLKDEENKDSYNDFNVVKNETCTAGGVAKIEDVKLIKTENEIKSQMKTVYESGPVEINGRKRKSSIHPTFIANASSSKHPKIVEETAIEKIEEVSNSNSLEKSGAISLFHEELDAEEEDLMDEEDDDSEMIRASSLFAKEVDDDFDNYTFDDGDAFY